MGTKFWRGFLLAVFFWGVEGRAVCMIHKHSYFLRSLYVSFLFFYDDSHGCGLNRSVQAMTGRYRFCFVVSGEKRASTREYFNFRTLQPSHFPLLHHFNTSQGTYSGLSKIPTSISFPFLSLSIATGLHCFMEA